MSFGPNLIVKNKINIGAEGKLITQNGVIEGEFSATPDSMIPKRFYSIITIREPINEEELHSMVKKLDEWNEKMNSLSERCYELFP